VLRDGGTRARVRYQSTVPEDRYRRRITALNGSIERTMDAHGAVRAGIGNRSIRDDSEILESRITAILAAIANQSLCDILVSSMASLVLKSERSI